MDSQPPPTSPASTASSFYLLDQAMGFMYSATLRAVAILGVADQLAAGPRTAAELAVAVDADAGSLHRALRLLTTRQIFREDDNGRFHLTPEAAALRSDTPESVRAGVIMSTMNTHWHGGGELVTALRQGGPVVDELFGAPFFEYLGRDQEAGATFHQGMASFSTAVDRAVVDQYGFPPTGTLVDVGGGYGGFLVRALRAHPGLRGILFDEEHVIAQHRMGELDDDRRWEAVAGDFFTEVPAGGDLYVLKYILHDWSDDHCLKILRNCRQAMASGGKVLVVDAVIREDNQPHTGKLLDLFMLALLTGRERTEAEFASLLNSAGLRLARVVHLDAPVSIVEAVAY